MTINEGWAETVCETRVNGHRLAGRVALITGGARGIGQAIAEGYSREGATVVVVDSNADGAETVAAQIVSAGGTALGLGADVGDAGAVDETFSRTIQEFGTVDVLVNNAGITSGVKHLFDVDDAWWETVIRTNLTGHYLCLSRAARIMAKAGGGAIINTSSGGATRAHRGMVPYDASKGGVEALTRAAAIDLAPYGIRVNSLVPGFINTSASDTPESVALRDATVPMGRGGRAEDLVGAAIFLASEEASYITGIRIPVDGGVLVQQRSPQVDTFPPTDYPDIQSITAFGV